MRTYCPRAAALVLRHWGERSDKARVYEAADIAKVLADIWAHGHRVTRIPHFAGMGRQRDVSAVCGTSTGVSVQLYRPCEWYLLSAG